MKGKMAFSMQTLQSFEQTLVLMDAAVTGAILGGVPPQMFELVLSQCFLRVALTNRNGSRPEQEISNWISREEHVWIPVLLQLAFFVNEFHGEVKDKGELHELDSLRRECQIRD